MSVNVNRVDGFQVRHAPEMCVWGERLLVDDSIIEEVDCCIWQEGYESEAGQELSRTIIKFCDNDKSDIEPTELVLELSEQQVDVELKKVKSDHSISIFNCNSKIVPECELLYNKDKLLNISHTVQSPEGSKSGFHNSTLMPTQNRSDVSLDALSNIVPESELAELLGTTDLLFCGSKSSRRASDEVSRNSTSYVRPNSGE